MMPMALALSVVSAVLTARHGKAAARATIDMGPTWGADRPGGDYSSAAMHSPKSVADNHYQSSALRCEGMCAADTRCCSWTYRPPPLTDDCILKASVAKESRRAPPSGDRKSWCGLPRRAVTSMKNATFTAKCSSKQPPSPPTPPHAGCKWPSSCKGLWDAVHCVCLPTWAYPGPAFQRPKIHNSPDCLHNPGWHDMAGAISVGRVHHVFQGCPDGPGSDSWNNHPDNHDTAGWHHATSEDFVHFKNLGIPPGLSAVKETYRGMVSDETPCSGFVTIDPDTSQVCAGFRQCHGSGVHGASKDGVPLEFRCTPVGDASLLNWSAPEFRDDINPSWEGGHIPYDPPRPWLDSDGLWYLAISVDACNGTNPCPGGGRLALWRSRALRGPKAAWHQIAPLFTANATKSGVKLTEGAVTGVFVTSNYIGGLPGDPAKGATRCVIQNAGGRTYWCGPQR
jgi:hypothetical protein